MLTNQEKVIVFFLIGASIVGLGVLYYRSTVAPVVTPQVVEIADKAQGTEFVCIDISGAVWRSGVYRLEKGARIDDVLSKAGLRPDANLDAINRAAFLRDGEKVVVPVKGNSSIDAPAVSKKININTAAENELQALPHVGEVRSRDIVNYRNAHGLFKTVEELKNVPGIGEGTFKRLKDLVVVK